jgi:hypothetical protein
LEDIVEFFNKELVEKYGGFAMEKQLFFADMVGKLSWNVDVESGEITFGNEMTFPMQILGTFSHSSESWLWAWANTKSGLPEKVVDQSKKLKQYGEANGIEFLTEADFQIGKDDMHYIGLVAVGHGKSEGYYLGNYGAGTMCLTVNSMEIGEKFPNAHHSIFTVFPQLISQFKIDHKKAFENYLLHKKYSLEKDGNVIVGIGGNKKVEATFDDLGRLKNLNGNA